MKLIMSLLIFGFIFSSIGFVFFVYGKKQNAVVPLICGLILMIFPYFVSNIYVLIALGIVFSIFPYFVRI